MNLSPYNLKQILFMSRKLVDFENGHIGLFDLFNDLRGLLYMMDLYNFDWKNGVENEINNLELIYDDLMGEEVNAAMCVKKLKIMTKSIIDNYLKVSDLSVAESAMAEDPDWLICPKCFDAWQSDFLLAMVVCPNCESALHNPRFADRKFSR